MKASCEAGCIETDEWQDTPIHFVNDKRSPPSGQWARVKFTVSSNEPYRIVLKQGGKTVARFYGTKQSSPSMVYYRSPGGQLKFEISECRWTTAGNKVWGSPVVEGYHLSGLDDPSVSESSAEAWDGAFDVEYGPGVVPPNDADPLPELGLAERPFNQAYFVQLHNTYEHGSIVTWLNKGLRSLELDVYDDDEWASQADGPPVSHDGNTNGKARLGVYLKQLASWMKGHPKQGPILLLVDLKADAGSVLFEGQWKGDEIALLDKKLKAILGSRLYTSQELLEHANRGIAASSRKPLRQAVAENKDAWPSLKDLRERVIVCYTGGRFEWVNQTLAAGFEAIVAQPGGQLPGGFFCPDVEKGDETEMRPGSQMDGMSVGTSQFMIAVNMRAQDHHQVVANEADRLGQILHLYKSSDPRYPWPHSSNGPLFNYGAVAHGVSCIGRDEPGSVTETFRGTMPLVGRRRSLPGYFRLRPLSTPGKRVEIKDAGTSEGATVWLAEPRPSGDGPDRQMFVYTAEGQLRPKHKNSMGLDVEGGDAESGKKIHLWDSDGGDTEKWVLMSDQSIRNFKNQNLCLTVQGGGLVVKEWTGSADQRFELLQEEAWGQTDF